ncbi:MAG: sodium:proton antiporter [Calditrichota bacterium]
MDRKLPLWSGLPFIGILLSIALGPLLTPHFWHHHFPKVSAAWALLFAVPFLFVYKDLALFEILHIYLIDYIPFIILLWGLFTVSGGILLRGTLVGTPIVNLLMILVGTILASWMGTTGAAMLMIRPILRANRRRKARAHIIVFFIFLVANIGGSLTPLGDPPLFLGFLHGVPFFWTFRLLPEMAFTAVIVLILFFIIDTIMWKREGLTVDQSAERTPIRLDGWHNFIFLGGIVVAVLMSGMWHAGHVMVYGIHVNYQNLTRDGLILLMGGLSLLTTTKIIHKDNDFSWAPILEVAYLFAGIFMTIIPMLAMLRAGVEGAMGFIVAGVTEPYHYFWISGALSSFLDNAPTYLTFFNLALGRLGINETQAAAMLRGVFEGKEAIAAEFASYLKAISVGAVFMGANTYIGNAPNFMVRSIAMEDGVKMPSFFGYMIWSICILIPVFGLVTVVFFL